MLENFISVKSILWAYALGFWAAEIFSSVCQQATSIQCVKYGNTYTVVFLVVVCWSNTVALYSTSKCFVADVLYTGHVVEDLYIVCFLGDGINVGSF